MPPAASLDNIRYDSGVIVTGPAKKDRLTVNIPTANIPTALAGYSLIRPSTDAQFVSSYTKAS